MTDVKMSTRPAFQTTCQDDGTSDYLSAKKNHTLLMFALVSYCA